MPVPILPETRRECDWIAGLSGTGLMVASGASPSLPALGRRRSRVEVVGHVSCFPLSRRAGVAGHGGVWGVGCRIGSADWAKPRFEHDWRGPVARAHGRPVSVAVFAVVGWAPFLDPLAIDASGFLMELRNCGISALPLGGV
jgi:hypothetical protein